LRQAAARSRWYRWKPSSFSARRAVVEHPLSGVTDKNANGVADEIE
jgi:hypothetical protein